LCIALLLGLSVSLVNAELPNETYDDTIQMTSGQTQLLDFPDITRISIGHEEVANAQALVGGQILLTGLKPGTTDVRLWYQDKQVRYLLEVIDAEWESNKSMIDMMLSTLPGIRMREEMGVIFIEGRLMRSQDKVILNLVREKLASAMSSGQVVFNVLESVVDLRAMIMLDVQVVEIRRKDLLSFGVEWETSTPGLMYEVSGPVSGVANFEKAYSFFGLGGVDGNLNDPLTSIGSTIELLENKGIARVLAQPKLVTRSGSEADFLVGGEVPIPVRGGDGELSVDFKQVGVILNFAPEADPDGYIATKINVEVSAIDESVKVLGIPGFISRKTNMEMNVQSGQTMVISGMLQTEDGKSINKVPGLGSIPILGELFKSRDFQSRTTELVVFVTPYFIDPESEQNQGMIESIQTNYSKSDSELKYSIYD
jgi:pilus assembly protein CpaC